MARDLANPSGMVVLPGGDLVVAEAGTGDHRGEGRFTGRILGLHDEDGDGLWLAPAERRVLVDGQISYNGRSVFGTGRDEVGGLGDVALGPDGRVLSTEDDPFRGYVADGARQDIAVSAVPADGGQVHNVVEGMTTLNAVVWDPRRERYFVIESGANRLVGADREGRRSPVAAFANLEDGQRAVPVGLAMDPRDGRLWGALVSGVLYNTLAPGLRRSFQPGAAKVVHLDPGIGEVRAALMGLTTAVDVAVGADGTVYVLEMTTEPPAPRLPDHVDLHDPMRRPSRAATSASQAASPPTRRTAREPCSPRVWTPRATCC